LSPSGHSCLQAPGRDWLSERFDQTARSDTYLAGQHTCHVVGAVTSTAKHALHAGLETIKGPTGLDSVDLHRMIFEVEESIPPRAPPDLFVGYLSSFANGGGWWLDQHARFEVSRDAQVASRHPYTIDFVVSVFFFPADRMVMLPGQQPFQPKSPV
jgi:hypothetical protein